MSTLTGILEWPARSEGRVRQLGDASLVEQRDDPFVPQAFGDQYPLRSGLEVTVADNGIVTGTNYGQIHQEAAGYFASFDTQLTNGVQGEGDEVTFDHVTKVDGDTQTGRVMWTLTPDVAAPDGLETKLTAADCDGLMDRIFPVIDEE